MKEQPDPLWELLRQEAKLPEPPAWFAARTLARLRQEQVSRPRWNWRWIWSGALTAALVVAALAGWQYQLEQAQTRAAQMAALDFLATSEPSQIWEETWFTSY
jgi:hypothetical protein